MGVGGSAYMYENLLSVNAIHSCGMEASIAHYIATPTVYIVINLLRTV